MKRLIPLCAMAALLVSCSPVPYDAGLADAAKTLLKMTQDNPSIVTVDFYLDPTETDLAFYPRLTASGFDYGIGFVSSTNSLDVRLRAVSYDAGAQALNELGFFSTTIPNQDPNFPAWSAWPAKDNPTYNAYLLLLTFDSLDPLSNNRLALNEVQQGSPPVYSTPGQIDLHSTISSLLDGEVIGGSVDADTSPGNDNTYWLARQSSPGHSLPSLSAPSHRRGSPWCPCEARFRTR